MEDINKLKVEDLYSTLEKVHSVNSVDPKYIFFNSNDIKNGLAIGLLENRKGRVVYGGIQVFDVIKKKEAITSDS